MSGISPSPTSETKPAVTAPTTASTSTSPGTSALTTTPDPAKPTSLLTDTPKPEEKPNDPKGSPGAPEIYGEFKAPEGYSLDTEFLTKEAQPLFKELGLSQEGAQKLIDLQSKYAAKANEAAEAPYKLWQNTQDEWVNKIKADPEIGGKLDLVKTTVARAIDGTLGPELGAAFREALNFTGGGNNPAIVRGLYKFAQKLAEGTPVTGNGPAIPGGTRPRSHGEALYPNNPQG